MATNNAAPPQPEPQSHFSPRARKFAVRVIAGSVLSGVVSLLAALSVGQELRSDLADAGGMAVFGLWFGLVALGTIATIVILRNQPDDPEVRRLGESRQRLNLAEGALEKALRENNSALTTEYMRRAIFVHGGASNPGISRSTDEVQPSEADPEPALARPQSALALPELWETTHARLNLYHEIATSQAKTSFRNAQVSMCAGFVLLVLFVVLALNASTTAGAIVAGGLGAVSAALSGYVSRTFIRSQEAAATHLRSYFDQPLELSKYLAAERLVADGGLTQEQRGEVLSVLVQAMVAAPAPLPSPVVVASVPGQQA
ncbi:hypothetical protein ACFUC2_32475 [[Kitasatospora] papulosa]|uniref:TRADD-N-associated membrane domain-containing protein n=1 Tax=[Kitasatospora] papulosa TaxID=1464011 RepID=UPI00363DC78A